MQRRYARLSVALFVLLASFAALVLVPSVTRADDAATKTLELQPGDNFIGWVAEPIAVADIFEQVPEATLIYTWSADSRRWRYVIRDVGGSLETLQPGMAAKIRIDGRKTVKWERSLTPAKGGITLYAGVNWVAWNGRDDWPLDQVARGIGTSLISIEVEERGIVYQPGSDISEAIEPLSAESTLRRGDALRVTVNRDLRWLQPTGMMPKIVWVGDIPELLREEITGDIQHVRDYFAESFAIETDFADTTVLVWHGVEAAVEHEAAGRQPDFNISSPEQLRVKLEHDASGWADDWGLVVAACWWDPPCPRPRAEHERGRDLLAHEWIHNLQIQYTDFWQSAGKPPSWMLEGTAGWAGDFGMRIADGHQSLAESRRGYLNNAKQTAATLRSAANRNAPWQYQLGLLAIDLLVERSGVDSISEYFRQQHPQPVGSERRWQVATTLDEAFEATFGLGIDEFYSQFEAWRDALPGRKVRLSKEPVLRGSLHRSNGIPASGFWINAAPHEGERKAGRLRRAEVQMDGSFSIGLLPDTVQRLYIEHEGCALWLTDDGLTSASQQPTQIRDLDTRNLPKLDLKLPDGACEKELRVRVQTRYGEDRRVEVGIRNNDSFTWTTPRGGGSFAVYPPEPSEYRVLIRYGYCDLWYAPDRLVAARNEAHLIDLTSEAISIEMRVPHDLCLDTISGQLIIGDGAPVPRIWVTANSTAGAGGSYPDADGKFKITVPDGGDYVLSFATDVEGCRIQYSSAGATTDWRRATPITVSDSDVTGIEFVVPDDPASLCR